MNLPLAFLEMCRRVGGRSKLADLSSELSGSDLLLRTLILRRALMREILADDERCVGLLLPPSVPSAVVNAALPLCRRVPDRRIDLVDFAAHFFQRLDRFTHFLNGTRFRKPGTTRVSDPKNQRKRDITEIGQTEDDGQSKS